MKKSIFLNQLKQIKARDIRIFPKIKRAGSLLFMNLAAPAAVYFKMDWPQGYDFLINKLFRKIKELRMQPDSKKIAMNKLLEELIGHWNSYSNKSTHRNPDLRNLPDWRRRYLLLGNIHRINNEFKKTMDVYKKIDEVQCHIAKKHQLDDLGIEFIPRGLPMSSIGMYEYFEVHVKAGILDLLPNKKMILLLDSKAYVNNPCYLKYWSKYFTIISDPVLIEMLTPLEPLLTTPEFFFTHFRRKLYWSPLSQGVVREQWRKEGRAPLFSLCHEDYEKGWNCLRSLGLPQNAWFVTLHVREPGWRDNHSPDENFRNADIKTYIPAIKAITDAGGWVLRIGDSGMSRIPEMPQLIDYAHSEVKSDWMDIFLCAQCRFMIGTSSGMCVIASAFGVPLVMTNLLPAYAVYHYTSQDLFIPRLCFSKGRGNHLSFHELISPPISTVEGQSHFDNRNIRVVPNSSEEIKALVEEMLEKCAGNLKYSEEDEILQKCFRETTVNCGKIYGEDLGLVSHARIGRKFLRDHAALLSANGAKEYQNER